MCVKKKLMVNTLAEVLKAQGGFFNYLKREIGISLVHYNEKKLLEEFVKYSKKNKQKYFFDNKKIDMKNMNEIKEKIFITVDLETLINNFITIFDLYEKSISTLKNNIDNCNKLITKFGNKNGNIHEKRRVETIKKINNDLKDSLDENGVDGVFEEALSETHNVIISFIGISSIYSKVINNRLYDPLINNNYLFLFGEQEIGSSFTEKKILNLNKTKREQFECFIKKYIKKHNILERLENSIKETYLVKNRLEIIKEGISYYERGKHLLSTIVLFSQVEGLITDSLILNGKEGVANSQTLSPKIDEFKSNYEMNFIKYTFEELRNDIAHGHIPKERIVEKNFIVISTLNYLTETLFNNNNDYDYKKIEKLLRLWLDREQKDSVILSFELLGEFIDILKLSIFISPVNREYIRNAGLINIRKEILKFITLINNWTIISKYNSSEGIRVVSKNQYNEVIIIKNCTNITNIEKLLRMVIDYYNQYKVPKAKDHEFLEAKKDIFKKLKPKE